MGVGKPFEELVEAETRHRLGWSWALFAVGVAWLLAAFVTSVDEERYDRVSLVARGARFEDAGPITKVLIDFAWTVGAHRVALDAFGTNTASQKVAERCGMTREGVLREAHVGNGGVRHDLVVYGLLRSDPPAPPDDPPSDGGGTR